jgi:flagellin
MVINTNIQALKTSNYLLSNQNNLSKSLSRLSSGSKIITASDDAAGLAVSTRLEAQVLRIDAALNNITNAVSFTQTQDGFLKSIDIAYRRMSELSLLAQDTTKGATDRNLYSEEFSQLQEFVKTTVEQTFNSISLFSKDSLAITVDSEGKTYQMNGIDLSLNKFSASVQTADNFNPSSTPSIRLSRNVASKTVTLEVPADDFLTAKSATSLTLSNLTTGKSKAALDLALSDKVSADAASELNPLSKNYFSKKEISVSDSLTLATKDANLLTAETSSSIKKTDVAILLASSGASTKVTGLFEKIVDLETKRKKLHEAEINNYLASTSNGTTIVRAIPTGLADLAAWKTDASSKLTTATSEFNTAEGLVSNAKSDVQSTGSVSDKSLVSNQIFTSWESSNAAVKDSLNDKLAAFKTATNSSDNSNAALALANANTTAALVVSTKQTKDANYTSALNSFNSDSNKDLSKLNGTYDIKSTSVVGGKYFVEIDIGSSETALAGSDTLTGMEVSENPSSTTPVTFQTGLDIKSVSRASVSLTRVKASIDALAQTRALLGATQNRMNFTLQQLNLSKENLASAISRITDVDVAEEATRYAQFQILVQSGTSMLAQANKLPQSALQLIQ